MELIINLCKLRGTQEPLILSSLNFCHQSQEVPNYKWTSWISFYVNSFENRKIILMKLQPILYNSSLAPQELYYLPDPNGIQDEISWELLPWHNNLLWVIKSNIM